MRSRILWLPLLLLAPFCASAGGQSVGDLSWMAGTWRGESDGVVMEEIWTDPAGGIMLGLHRDVTPKRTSFEFIRIAETPDGIVYFASPSGRPPTPFRLTESGPQRAVFSKPDHDFPKRIVYWRDGARLCARVEGDAEADAQQWCWEKSP